MAESRTAGRRAWHTATSPVCLAVVLAVLFPAWAGVLEGEDHDQPREFAVVGRDCAYAPPRLEVRRNDLVKIRFTAADIAHSFAIDEYRIAKRAAAGQTIVFEFRADQSGRFKIYCNLTADDRCRQMVGELIVNPSSD
jgi:hypothetical protein